MQLKEHFSGDISFLAGRKILFANFPADGHFNPLTGLAVFLKEQGCDVRWYTSKHYKKKVEQFYIPFYPLKKALDVNAAVDLEEVFPGRKKIKGQVARLKFDMVHAFVKRAPEYYDDIKDIYHEFPFEVMIADVAFGGIPFVKELMNIPVIAVSVMPLTETSKDLPPAGLGLTPADGLWARLKNAALRYVSDKLLFSGPNKVLWDILDEYGIEGGGISIFDMNIRKSTIVLQSGTPSFEYFRSDISPNIHFAGPLLPYQKNTTGRWYNDKLKKYEKVVLVTQGTVEKDVDKLLVPALEALKDTGCLVIVTTGGSHTQQLKAKYEAENIIIEDFIPFNDVMPYTDVYVSNGGYGGVLISIQNGVPMVVAGVHEGKNEINARIGYFKLGVNLRTEKPAVLHLRKAVEAVLENLEFKTNVLTLTEEFMRYDPKEIIAAELKKLLPAAKRSRVQAAVAIS